MEFISNELKANDVLKINRCFQFKLYNFIHVTTVSQTGNFLKQDINIDALLKNMKAGHDNRTNSLNRTLGIPYNKIGP